jgi:hypothetical protein
MARLIFDIESVGEDFEKLDKHQQEDIERWSRYDSGDIEEFKDKTSFWPLTAQIVAIAMLNPDTNKGAVYFQAPNQKIEPFEEHGIRYEAMSETEMIERFWMDSKNYNQFITCYGRRFDIPFLMIRSAIHGIRPGRNFFGGAYSGRYDAVHIDLADRLSFHGAMRKQFSLHWWCRAFGIKSPKETMVGYEVKEQFQKGNYIGIARYCMGDIYATKELLEKWEQFLNFDQGF